MRALAATPAANDQRYVAMLRTRWKLNKSFQRLAKPTDLLGMSSSASVFDMVLELKESGYVICRI